jgi:branched-chain amino acid transport system substrate-binding protein
LGSVVGYAALKTIAAAITKAGSTEPKAIAAALRGLTLDSPLGRITYRAADQQSTMGTFVGRLTVKDGMPRMVDWRYGDGTQYLPSEAEAAKMRPAE